MGNTRPLDVRVSGGYVRGVREGGTIAWRGIPYAAPPIGRLRFRAPQRVVPWNGFRDAASFGRVAPQAHKGQFAGVSPDVPSGEDCLTVNVVAPETAASDAPLPVMVFIHGGGYSTGSSRDFSGQGLNFVATGKVVYVSFNYRLGALGYLDFSRYSTTAATDRLEPGAARSDRRAALGAPQHPCVRRRPRAGDGVRRVGRRELGHDAHGHAVGPRSVRAGDRSERAPERRLHVLDGGRLGRAVRRDPAQSHTPARCHRAAHDRQDGRAAHRRACRRPRERRARPPGAHARGDPGSVLPGTGRRRSPAAAASDGRLPRRLRASRAADHRHERPGGLDLPRAPRHPAPLRHPHRGRPRARAPPMAAARSPRPTPACRAGRSRPTSAGTTPSGTRASRSPSATPATRPSTSTGSTSRPGCCAGRAWTPPTASRCSRCSSRAMPGWPAR